MKYIYKLFLSLKDILLITFLEYGVLFLCFIFLEGENRVIYGSIFIVLIMLIYIISKRGDKKVRVSTNSFFYILLGISLAGIFNMLCLKFNPRINYIDINLFFIVNILISGIISPIFEEVLFRQDLIFKLEKFNSKRWVIILLDTLIFGLSHFDILNMLYGFIIGFVNAYLYTSSKDITKPILIHVSGNIMASFLFRYNRIMFFLFFTLLFISLMGIKREKC